MKIHVSRVPPEGINCDQSYDPKSLDMERKDVHLRDPIDVLAAVTKVDEQLVVKADIQCLLRPECARCLEEFELKVKPGALFTYTVKPTDVVDITDDVRQEIILSYPLIPICSPDCKGLCAQCGQNLNVKVCNHQATAQSDQEGPALGGSIVI